METWPNFFIVGAPKAGTTSLYNYLNKVHGIYMSPIKEPNYFSCNTVPDDHPICPIRNKNKYLALFKKATNENLIGEGSVAYFNDPESPKLIHQTIPKALILISLRDPVERVYSDYLMNVRMGWITSTFHEVIHIDSEHRKKNVNSLFSLGTSLYSSHVKRYFDTFSKKQVKILMFEEFIQNPKETLNALLISFGLNQHFDGYEEEIFNPYQEVRGPIAQYILSPKIGRFAERVIPSAVRKFVRKNFLLKKVPKPQMNQEDKLFLQNFFRDDVRKLENLLKRKFPWPNFQR